MTLASIDFSDTSDDPIAGYPAFRTAAAAAAQGDFAEAVTLDDGGVVALRLDAIVPATPIPLDEAKDAVPRAGKPMHWTKRSSRARPKYQTAVEAGASLGQFGIVSVTPEIARDGFVEGTPSDFLQTVFAMTEGEIRLIEAKGFTGLVRLDSIKPAEATGDAAEALKAAIDAQAEQALAQDAFALFSAALTTEAGIHLDEAAINAVHAQFR